MSDKVTVIFRDKSEELELVTPGVAKRGNAFLVKCSKTGEWCYCTPARLEKLKVKYGSIENVGASYLSRAGAQEIRAEKEVILMAESNAKIGLPSS